MKNYLVLILVTLFYFSAQAQVTNKDFQKINATRKAQTTIRFEKSEAVIKTDGSSGYVTHEIKVLTSIPLPIDLRFKIEPAKNFISNSISKAFTGTSVLKKSNKEQIISFKINKKELKESGLKRIVLDLLLPSSESLKKYGIEFRNVQQTITIQRTNPPLTPQPRITVKFNTNNSTIINDDATGNLKHEVTVQSNRKLPADIKFNIEPIKEYSRYSISKSFYASSVIKNSSNDQVVTFTINKQELKKSGLEKIELQLSIQSDYLKKYGIALSDELHTITIENNFPTPPPPPSKIIVNFESYNSSIKNDGKDEELTHKIKIITSKALPSDLEFYIQPSDEFSTFNISKDFSGSYIIEKSRSEKTITFKTNKKELRKSGLEKIEFFISGFSPSQKPERYVIESSNEYHTVLIKNTDPPTPPPSKIIVNFDSTNETIYNDGNSGFVIHEAKIIASKNLPVDLECNITPKDVNVNGKVKSYFNGNYILRKSKKEHIIKFKVDKKALSDSKLKEVVIELSFASSNYSRKYGIELGGAIQTITIQNPNLPNDTSTTSPTSEPDKPVGNITIDFKSSSSLINNDGSSNNLSHNIIVTASEKLPIDVEYKIEALGLRNYPSIKRAFSNTFVFKESDNIQNLNFHISKKELEESGLEKFELKLIPSKDYKTSGVRFVNNSHSINIKTLKTPGDKPIVKNNNLITKLSIILGLAIPIIFFILFKLKYWPFSKKVKERSKMVGGDKSTERPKRNDKDDDRGNTEKSVEFPEDMESGEDEMEAVGGVIPPAKFTIVPTFYGTDREPTGKSEPDKMFGSERGNLSFGICEVSIPKTHKMGEIESPLWGLKIFESDKKHIILKKVTALKEENFINLFKEKISQTDKKSALIFVHGFNVSFSEAAKRTAQIAYDLKFDGVPSFYSWPSHAKTMSYLPDEANIEWTQPNMKAFLEKVLTDTPAENIYIIAHSMGTRALSKSIASIIENKPILKKKIQEIILTAPDIDADVFKRDIAPRIVNAGNRLTLYASSEDVALKTSKTIHQSSRAGESGDDIVLVEGMNSIDATGMDSGFLKHSYYGDSRNVLIDISLLIDGMSNPEDRKINLDKIETSKGVYWEFRK